MLTAADLAQLPSSPSVSPSPSGGTGTGTNGQVWATVSGVAQWTFSTLITAVGTIASGVWQGTKIGLSYGGTNADLSGTGGAHKFLRQNSIGANIDVVQPDFSDLASTLSTHLVAGTNITLSGTDPVTINASGGGGSGTVTSVSMTVPAELSVSGSPITTSGTLAVTWASESNKTILSRIAGSSGVPSFNTIDAVLDAEFGTVDGTYNVKRTSGAWSVVAAPATAAFDVGDWERPRVGNAGLTFQQQLGMQENGLGGLCAGTIAGGPIAADTIQPITPPLLDFWMSGVHAGSYMLDLPYTTGPNPTGRLYRETRYFGLVNPNGFTFIGQMAYGDRAIYGGARANGKPGAETHVNNGDAIARYRFWGYGTTGLNSPCAGIDVAALENFSDTAQGASVTVSVTKTGTATATAAIIATGQGTAVLGTNTNDSAAAGYVGEYVHSQVKVGSGVALTSTVLATVTSISLTAGDWDVEGTVWLQPAGTTTVTELDGMVTATAPPTFETNDSYLGYFWMQNNWPAGKAFGFPTGRRRFSLASTTTIYLGAYAVFGVSTCTATGEITARRVR